VQKYKELDNLPLVCVFFVKKKIERNSKELYPYFSKQLSL